MRVGVLGAGAMGGTIAALLDRAGHDVEVTARGDHLAAIRQRGLRLSGAFGEYLAPVAAGPALSRRPEFVLVTTKAMDAPQAVTENLRLIDGVPIIVLQNGLGGVERVAATAPNCEVVGALSMFAASYLGPGELAVTADGTTFLGSGKATGGPDGGTGGPGRTGGTPAGGRSGTRASGGATMDTVRSAAEVLGSAVPVEVVDDFVGAQWSKLVVNQVNALPAITGLSVQQVIRNRRLRALLTGSMREAVRVGLARKVRFATLQQVNHRRLKLFAQAPPVIGQLLPVAIARRMGAAPNPGSTLQSIRRGQLTEIDYLNGAVVEQARGTGVPAPVNGLMVDLVHEIERTGRHLSPAEVSRRARRSLPLR